VKKWLLIIYLYGYHVSDGVSAKEYEKEIISAVVMRTKKYNLASMYNYIASTFFLLFIIVVIIRFAISLITA
jgi:hypothetical protein